MLRREDVIGDYLDEENTSEEQHNNAIEMPEASAEIEDECEGSSRISLLGDTCTTDPCLRRSRLRVTGGERRCREMEVGSQNIHKLFSIIYVNWSIIQID